MPSNVLPASWGTQAWLLTPTLISCRTGTNHILPLLHGIPCFSEAHTETSLSLFCWGLSRRAPDSQDSLHPTAGAWRCKLVGPPLFCRLSRSLCGTGRLQHMLAEPRLKMILGSLAQGQAPSSLPSLLFGGAGTPHNFSFAFSFCASAFHLEPFAASFAVGRLVCALQRVLCSQELLSISSLLVAGSSCKAASGLGLQPSPWLSFFPPFIHRGSGDISCPLYKKFFSSRSTPPSSAIALC